MNNDDGVYPDPDLIKYTNEELQQKIDSLMAILNGMCDSENQTKWDRWACNYLEDELMFLCYELDNRGIEVDEPVWIKE